jgi:hydrogenase-4 membrane subunit HyfE
VPESRSRRRKAWTAPPVTEGGPRPNPPWFVPVMLTLMVVGLVWVVVFYVTETRFPVPGIGNWNLVAGFALVLAGFVMTTRWR